MKKLILIWNILFLTFIFSFTSMVQSVCASDTKLYAIYRDTRMADLAMNDLRGNGGMKFELYRDGAIVGTWTPGFDDIIYYSDTTTGSAKWLLQTYSWSQEAGDWVADSSASYEPTSITASGTLHNETEWLGKLGRSRVSWTNLPNFYVDKVTVRGGIDVDNVTINLQNDGSYIEFYDDLEVFNGLTINNSSSGDTGIVFSGINNMPKFIKNMSITGTNSFRIRDCTNIVFNNLTFSPGPSLSDYTDFLNNAVVEIDKTSGNIGFSDSVIPYLNIAGTANVIVNSRFGLVAMTGDENHLDNSQIKGAISISGNGNKITHSKVTMQVVTDYGFDLDFGAAITVSGEENQVVNNTIVSGYDSDTENGIEVSGQNNKITDNNIGDVITLGSDGYKNGIFIKNAWGGHIRKNYIYDMSSAGIKLVNGTEHAHVWHNFIFGGNVGIEVQGCSNNSFNHNEIEDTDGQGILIYSLVDAKADWNAVAFNSLVNTKNGLELGCIGNCDNATPTVTYNTIYENLFANFKDPNGIGKDCSLIEMGIGSSKTHFFGNKIHPFCNPGLFRAHDLGKDNTFYDNTSDKGGNYWDNYTGIDGPDLDPFGDTPYDIQDNNGAVANQDRYPLVIDSGAIRVTPDRLEFGPESIYVENMSASATLPVTITNIDNTFDLVITGITRSGPERGAFNCNSGSCATPIILGPGQSHVIYRTFRPFKEGAHTAKMHIYSNDKANPRVTLEVTGNGTGSTATSGIAGRVTDGTSGAGGVVVRAYVLENTQDPVATTITTAEGDYLLTGFPSGQYRIHFDGTDANCHSEWFNDKPEADASDPVAYTHGCFIYGVDAELVPETFTLNALVIEGDGTVSPETGQVGAGQSGAIDITPGYNSVVSQIGGNCPGVLLGNIFLTDPITEDCTIEAHFDVDRPMLSIILGFQLLSGKEIAIPGHMKDIDQDGRIGLPEIIRLMQSMLDGLMVAQ